jgi:prepilin-type N-terminal cleavage/methylation domain-containing protein
MNFAKRRAFSMVEMMVCMAVLGSGSLALFSASSGTVKEASWSAERVFAEGLARDLVETYRQLDYCALKNRPEVKPTEDAITPEDLTTIKQLEALSITSTLTSDAGADASGSADTLSAEYSRMLQSLQVERMVLLEERDPGESVVLTCIVKWRSRTGQAQRIERRFAVVRRGECS